MTNEQERHNQANDLVEITEQADAQNPVGMTTDKSADSEEVADDARVSDDNPTFPTEGAADDLQCVDNQCIYFRSKRELEGS